MSKADEVVGITVEQIDKLRYEIIHWACYYETKGERAGAISDIEKLCALARRAAPAQEPVWMPIESAPKDGRTLLLGHFNGCGKWRTLRGQWFTKAQIEEEWESDDCDEGWYETSVENDDIPNCWPTDPSHYILLPQPPLYAKPTDSGSVG